MNRIITLAILLMMIYPCITIGNENQNIVSENIFQEEISLNDSGLKIFPNPVKGNKFTVSAEKDLKEIRMHNILGQKTHIELSIISQNKYSVLIKEKKKGIYLVTVIFDDNSKLVHRIVVN